MSLTGIAALAALPLASGCLDGASSVEAASAKLVTCPGLAPKPFRGEGTWLQPGTLSGKPALPGITLLTGADLKPFQTSFCDPELADPYVTLLKDAAVVSGTAQFYLKFPSLASIAGGGPYQVVWNDFYYSDGTPMEGDRYYAHSWDMKPVSWALSDDPASAPRLWDPVRDADPPRVVWYGGHMRPRPGAGVSRWPEDNWSRDVFAFVEKAPGKWSSLESSVFARRGTWPRAQGSFLGHRYGHQIVMVPRLSASGREERVAAVFYEEVTDVRADGSPAITRIFMDEMATPLEARGKPVELLSPVNPASGKPYPSARREDGSLLIEGPLYFRFDFEGEPWEAIGFSAGSFYAKYPAAFASRKVSDGLLGKPYEPDLTDDGADLHDAGAELGRALGMAGGPGRPAVIVGPEGMAVTGPQGGLQVLVHGYRKEILPDNDYSIFPVKYRLDQMYRVIAHASLKIERSARGPLRFRIQLPEASVVERKLASAPASEAGAARPRKRHSSAL